MHKFINFLPKCLNSQISCPGVQIHKFSSQLSKFLKFMFKTYKFMKTHTRIITWPNVQSLKLNNEPTAITLPIYKITISSLI